MDEKKIAVVDDHKLFRSGLVNLIGTLGPQFKVTIEASNGKEFISLLTQNDLPDIAIVDINMPVMNGYETAEALQKSFPSIKVLIITMVEDETTLLKMLKLGIKGYLSKDVEPTELRDALESISDKGYYYTDYVTGKLIEVVQEPNQKIISDYLKDRERIFLELACSEYTYKEIADKMCVSAKTVDGYRNALFEKLGAKSRVGLVIYAIKNGIVRF